MKEGINTGVLDSKLNPIAVGDYLIPDDTALADAGAYYKVSKYKDARFFQPHVHGVKSCKLRDIAPTSHVGSDAEIASLMELRNTRKFPNRKKKAGSVSPVPPQDGTEQPEPDVHMKDGTISVNLDRAQEEERKCAEDSKAKEVDEMFDDCAAEKASDKFLVHILRKRGYTVTCTKTITVEL